jgi:hypothetical protein
MTSQPLCAPCATNAFNGLGAAPTCRTPIPVLLVVFTVLHVIVHHLANLALSALPLGAHGATDTAAELLP